VVPPDLLGSVLHHLVERRRRSRPPVDLSSLTNRETEVFELAAEGLRKEEIAERLYISPATARTHLQRVYRKLSIHSQAELMTLAVHGGREEKDDRSE
jgi:DNA-binding CsgD family transcriptional regulator